MLSTPAFSVNRGPKSCQSGSTRLDFGLARDLRGKKDVSDDQPTHVCGREKIRRLRPLRAAGRRCYKSTGCEAAAAAAAGTELYSSPHSGVGVGAPVRKACRAGDTPLTTGPEGRRPAGRPSAFRSGCKRKLADIWPRCRRQSPFPVWVIYCPDCRSTRPRPSRPI